MLIKANVPLCEECGGRLVHQGDLDWKCSCGNLTKFPVWHFEIDKAWVRVEEHPVSGPQEVCLTKPSDTLDETGFDEETGEEWLLLPVREKMDLQRLAENTPCVHCGKLPRKQIVTGGHLYCPHPNKEGPDSNGYVWTPEAWLERNGAAYGK